MNTVLRALEIMKTNGTNQATMERWTAFLNENTYFFNFLGFDVFMASTDWIGHSICSMVNILKEPYMNVICFDSDIFAGYNDKETFIEECDTILYHEIGHILDPRVLEYLKLADTQAKGKFQYGQRIQINVIELEYFADEFSATLTSFDKNIWALTRMNEGILNDPTSSLHKRIVRLKEIAKIRNVT